MAKTKAFEIAELIRVFKYNTTTDEIETTREKNHHICVFSHKMNNHLIKLRLTYTEWGFFSFLVESCQFSPSLRFLFLVAVSHQLAKTLTDAFQLRESFGKNAYMVIFEASSLARSLYCSAFIPIGFFTDFFSRDIPTAFVNVWAFFLKTYLS